MARHDQGWMPGDVYFGDTEKPLPNWREELSQSDEDDDTPMSAEERAAHVVILGFDPDELDWKTPPKETEDFAALESEDVGLSLRTRVGYTGSRR